MTRPKTLRIIGFAILSALFAQFVVITIPSLRTFDRDFAEIGIHARVTSDEQTISASPTIHSRDTARPLTLVSSLLFCLGIAAILATAESRMRPVHLAESATALAFSVLLSSIPIRILLDVLLPISAAVITTLSLLLALLMYRAIWERKEKDWITAAFAMYISPKLVEIIAKDPSTLTLDGEEKLLTILFSDLQDFTKISESTEPKALLRFLNEYFSGVTQIIFSHGGTVDKYIGDAVMAFWNAPLTQDGHAALGVAAAMEISRFSDELSKKISKDFGIPAVTRLGINTGEAVIGNIGSNLRFNYTTIGDEVNLASRLEGLNGYYGTRILVSGKTEELTRNQVIYREIDRVRVKGKQQATVIFEPMTLTGACPGPYDEQLRTSYANALQLFRARKFEQALNVFQLCTTIPGSDEPSRIMGARCQQYLLVPPPPDWDGTNLFLNK